MRRKKKLMQLVEEKLKLEHQKEQLEEVKEKNHIINEIYNEKIKKYI